VNWGRVEFSGSLLSDELRATGLELRRGGARARIAGRAGTGLHAGGDALELRASLAGWPAEDFVRALGWRIPLSGPLHGDVRLEGRRPALTGELRLASAAGLYHGVPFEDLELAALLREGRIEIPGSRARLGSGRLSFRGSVSDDGQYDGSAEAEAVEAGELLKALAPGWPVTGKLSGRVTLQGPLDRPRLSGELNSQRLFLGDEGVGAVRGVLTGAGDGRVAVEANCRSARLDLTVSGTLSTAVDGPAELRLRFTDTSLDPFLRQFYPALPSAATLVASGVAELSGPLGRPEELRGTAQVSELLLGLPEYPVRNAEPLRFRLEKEAVRVEELRLAGDGTDLRISGVTGMRGQTPLNLSVEGTADLRVLTVVTRRLRGRGAARLEMNVTGDVATPQLEGLLRLSGAGVRVRGFPVGLDSLTGNVRFSETGAELEGVNGSLGGGPVELSGSAGFRRGGLSAVDIKLAGQRVTLPYPEGLRSVLDLDLRLFGDAARQWLSGEIQVRHALWTRRYDLASELLAAGAPPSEPDSFTEGLRYDVKLRAPGTLEVDNNLATLRASAELDLAGSSEQPAVLGRAEIERGRVYFQGNTYTIRRGSVDFANPRRIDPSFNIEAETNIRSYRITLNVNGTLQRVYPALSSDPPLSAVQIVNLLAGADDSQLASFTLSQSEQTRLAVAGAATLAAGGLSEYVGLERQAQRIGLSRFSIDPALVRGDFANPTARLTVGKRITPDLNVLYSIDLKSGKQQLISAEYTLSDRFSVLLTGSEDGGIGVDVRVRQSR
jgi:autotransporter translocation and assembly factor TamB